MSTEVTSGEVLIEKRLDASTGMYRTRIVRADKHARISAFLLQEIEREGHFRAEVDGDRLTLRDDFGQVIAYRLGEYDFRCMTHEMERIDS